MADIENGLPLFSSLDISSKDATDKKSQSANYLANNHLAPSKYSSDSEYIDKAPENGLAHLQYNHIENSDAPTYVDRVNKDGSAILAKLAGA